MNPYTGGYDLCLEASEDVLSAFVGAAVGARNSSSRFRSRA
jgi:hypothetical protein